MKLFSIDEHQVQDDLAELQRRIDVLEERDPQETSDHDDEDDVFEDSEGGRSDAQENYAQENDDQENDLEVDVTDEVVQDGNIEDQTDDIYTDHDNNIDVQEPEKDEDAEDLSDVDPDEDAEGPQGSGHGGEAGPGDGPARNTRSRSCNCCCGGHCRLTIHTLGKRCQAFISTKVHALPCDLTTYTLEPELKVMNLNPEEDEPLPSDDMDSDTLTKVLLSLNLEM